VLVPSSAAVVVQAQVSFVDQPLFITQAFPVPGPLSQNWYWYGPAPPLAAALKLTVDPYFSGLGWSGVRLTSDAGPESTYETDLNASEATLAPAFRTYTDTVFIPPSASVLFQFQTLAVE
jgi:hypothetical protein